MVASMLNYWFYISNKNKNIRNPKGHPDEIPDKTGF